MQCRSPGFNSRSREGSDSTAVDVLDELDVSIHAPARGATYHLCCHLALSLFQFTLPRGERPLSCSPWASSFSSFNSRSREGSDGS